MDIGALAREITAKVAGDTAEILHVRNDLGILDDPIDEQEFKQEAIDLATGEETGCLEEDEALDQCLMTWVKRKIEEMTTNNLSAPIFLLTYDSTDILFASLKYYRTREKADQAASLNQFHLRNRLAAMGKEPEGKIMVIELHEGWEGELF